MGVNSQFAVAIHLLALLAMNDRPLSSKMIASSAGTNPVFIRRIIGDLNRAGLVVTQMGMSGGVSLAREPEDIRLSDVYHATNQGDLFALHHSQPNAQCLCGNNIQPVLTTVFDEAEHAVEQVLGQHTVADVVADILDRQLNGPTLPSDDVLI